MNNLVENYYNFCLDNKPKKGKRNTDMYETISNSEGDETIKSIFRKKLVNKVKNEKVFNANKVQYL